MSNPTIHQAGHEHAISEDASELLESHGVLWHGDHWTLGPGVIEPVDSFRVYSIACIAIMEELARMNIDFRLFAPTSGRDTRIYEGLDWNCCIYPGDFSVGKGWREVRVSGPTPLAALLAAHEAARKAK